MKNIRVFYLKTFQFLEVKFSVYLNRRVFVMGSFFYHCFRCAKSKCFKSINILT